jgi:hypothetical protein
VADELLFTVTGNTATPAEALTLDKAGLWERKDLQEWVLKHPEILGPDILIVTFEFDQWQGPSTAPKQADRLDILGLAADGFLVVAELKRDRAPDFVSMQAIKYAAMASRFTTETLASQHARFLTQQGTPTTEDEALQRLQAHAGDLDIDNLRKPRIVILAGEFPTTVTSAVIWLSEMGLDMKLIRVSAYQSAHDIVISVTQVFPIPKVEDFVITPRQAEVQAVEEKRQRQKDVSTTVRLIAAKVIADGTPLKLRPQGVNETMRLGISKWIAEKPDRGWARWENVIGTPLTWHEDGNRYSLSGLAQMIVEEATGVLRSIRGGDWWVTEDGRDLVEIAESLSVDAESAPEPSDLA